MAKSPRKKGAPQGVDLEATLISIERLRLIAIVVVVAVALFLGWFFGIRKGEDPETLARKSIAEAQDYSTRAATSPNLQNEKTSFEAGTALLEEAKSMADSKSWSAARDKAADAQSKFRLVLNVSEAVSDAIFQQVEGSVQLQKGAGEAWIPARTKMPLSDGDFVKTGPNGTAEIRFNNDQVHTVRPETLFEVKRIIDPNTKKKRIDIKLSTGIVSVVTSDQPGRIITPTNMIVDVSPETKSEVKVGQDSSASVSVWEGNGASVTTAGGQKVNLKSREGIAQRADQSLEQKVALPDVPTPVRPIESQSFDIRTTSNVNLVWLPVAGAARYHLQIARGRFFVMPEVDVTDRTKPEQAIRLLQDGSYFWRVSAISASGAEGDFSSARRFKLVSPASERSASTPSLPGGTSSPVTRNPPPPLSLDPSVPIGSLWLLAGQTEPGATVTVNGQPANVDATGKWSFSYSFPKVGLNEVVIRASTGGEEARIVKQWNYEEQ